MVLTDEQVTKLIKRVKSYGIIGRAIASESVITKRDLQNRDEREILADFEIKTRGWVTSLNFAIDGIKRILSKK